ncbi:hypothetical protein ZWY2020_025604 [Hordeum vulgare]|nr:hypothetical protein ZWY2020_025604 [Hordeum vulgare]
MSSSAGSEAAQVKSACVCAAMSTTDESKGRCEWPPRPAVESDVLEDHDTARPCPAHPKKNASFTEAAELTNPIPLSSFAAKFEALAS